jgi:hypothetical protein
MGYMPTRVTWSAVKLMLVFSEVKCRADGRVVSQCSGQYGAEKLREETDAVSESSIAVMKQVNRELISRR